MKVKSNIILISVFAGCLGPREHNWRRARTQGLRDPAGGRPAAPHLHQPRHPHLLPQERHLGRRQSMQK